MTDFNVASYYSVTKPLTSVAGSMAYIAPEVISRQGYGFTPDWWSLGVTLYEVLFGVRPYNGRSGQELMANIEKGDVPEFFRDPKGKCSPMCIEVLRGVSISLFSPPYVLSNAYLSSWWRRIRMRGYVVKAASLVSPRSRRCRGLMVWIGNYSKQRR